MCHRMFIQQRQCEALWSDSTEEFEGGVGSLDSPEHTVSPQPPVWAPGGRFWTLPGPPALGGWSAAAGPLLLSPSQRSWCTAGGSHPDLWEPHRKTFSIARQGERCVFAFLISCKEKHLHNVFWWAWYRSPCQHMRGKSLKCEHRLCFVWSLARWKWESDRKCDRFALVNAAEVLFCFNQEAGSQLKRSCVTSLSLFNIFPRSCSWKSFKWSSITQFNNPSEGPQLRVSC